MTDGACVPIRSVTTTTATTLVYNIETDTNDYCVPFVVHNSNEVTEGRGFVGASGRILDASLEAGGLSRASVSVTNTILCMPPDGSFDDYVETLKTEHAKGTKRWTRRWAGNGKDVTPEEWARTAQLRFRAAYDAALREGVTPPEGPPELSLPQDRCRARLHKDLVEANATVVLAVGKKALEQVTTFEDLMTGGGRGPAPHVASLKKQHGAPVVLPDGRVLMASYHPAFAMRERCEYMPVIRSNITRAAQIAKRGGLIDWHEPPFLVSPDVDLCLRTLDRYLAAGAEVAVDIETDDIDPHTCGLRCVGLAANVGGEEVVIVIPFRRRDGAFWWASYEDGLRVALKLREVLDNLPLVFQNGQFDTTVLLRLRLMTNGAKTYSDTLLYHHNTPDNDLPHDLGFLARRFFEAPLWKENIDHKSVSSQSDFELHEYCARDVLITLRLMGPLRAWVDESGTEPQNETDRRMAVRTREMSELGLVCNEWLRGKLSQRLNRQCYDLIREFQEIVGRPVNPRSSAQLQELLYVDWGYQPVIATDGYDWEAEVDDVADGSTSNAAITQLIDQRAPHPKHVRALEKLLEFRANDKIRGTYTDNLKTYDLDWSEFEGSPSAIGWVDPITAPVWDETLGREVEVEVAPRRRALSLVRTTYKGFVVPTGRLASSNPNCFSPDTEVLTRRGWVALPALCEGEEVAQFDPESRAVTFVVPLERTRRHYEGDLVHAHNTAIDLLCTPDHRLLFFRDRHFFVRRAGEPWPRDARLRSVDGQHAIDIPSAEVIVEHVPYAGEVFCLRVPTSFVLTRRNRKPLITGQCQNVPARARGGLNLRSMYVAPPGHVIVGADFNQIELRLYAAIAKDRLLLEAIRTGLDAHTLNAASMMAKPGQKLMDVYQWLKAKPKEELKYLRTVAKRFCIAEGQRVLTDRGPVPIEKVLLTDRLWDGIEWVSHDGVIDQGEREVITYDGLTATPDHEVYLEDGRKVPFGTAAAQHLRLARGSEGWRPLRFVGCNERSVAREGPPEGEGPLRVWCREGGLLGQPAVWKVDAVPQLRDEDRALGRWTGHAQVGAGPLSVGEEPLHEPRRRAMGVVRWARHRVPFRVCRGSGALDDRQLRVAGAVTYGPARPHQQQWSLRAGEPALGDCGEKRTKPTLFCHPGELDLPRGGVALLASGGSEQVVGRTYSRTDSRGRTSDSSAATWQELGGDRAPSRTARTYDILNAGPRRRFVTENVMISNCFGLVYGSGWQTMYNVMVADRDKATGKRTFPNLTQKDCQEWEEAWHTNHPETNAWHAQCHAAFKQFGFTGVPILDRRKRFFPGGVAQENAIPNLTIQGSAASIANRALLAVAEEIPYRGWSRWSGLVLQVHDYIGVIVPESRYEEAIAILERCMIYSYEGMVFDAQATATWSWGDQ